MGQFELRLISYRLNEKRKVSLKGKGLDGSKVAQSLLLSHPSSFFFSKILIFFWYIHYNLEHLNNKLCIQCSSTNCGYTTYVVEIKHLCGGSKKNCIATYMVGVKLLYLSPFIKFGLAFMIINFVINQWAASNFTIML